MPIKKSLSPKQASVLGLAVASALSTAPVYAQVDFEQNANGQAYSYTFPNNPPATGTHTDTGNFPNDNNWSQQEVTSVDSSGDAYESQPSNWSTPTYPNSPTVDVELGDFTVSLNISVEVGTLDLSGALNILNNESLTVAGAGITDNGTITLNSQSGGNTTVLSFNGGTVSGTGTIVMNSTGSDAQLNGTLTQVST